MQKKNIIRILVLFSVAFIITTLGLLFTGPRMRNQLSLVAYESVLNLPPDDIIPFESSKKLINTIEINEENISKGKVYYHYYCVFCHGEHGNGDGPVGESYIPRPSDLNNNVIQSYDSTQLYKAAFGGVHSPVLGNIIKPEHKRFILLFIQNGLKKP